MGALDDFLYAQTLTYEDHWGDHYDERDRADAKWHAEQEEIRNASLRALPPYDEEQNPLDRSDEIAQRQVGWDFDPNESRYRSAA